MPPPFGLTHLKFFELHEDRAQLFLDHFLEVFGLQA
jgi:hypothetical protein